MGFFNEEHPTEEHSGVDDWLMSYADMITLILCFFAVLLAVSVPKEQKIIEAQKEMAEVFAKPPKTDVRYTGKPINVQTTKQVDGESILPGLSSFVNVYNDNRRKIERPKLSTEEKSGKRITTIEMDSSLFFAAGSATLSEEGKKVLAGVEERLQAPIYDGYMITIEGHTDDSPIHTALFPSNWELSSARASAVVRYFIEQGMVSRRLRAAGYADTQPKAPNRDIYNHPIPENQTKNRRVVIKLEKIEG